jgi:hypothetical protein
MTGMIVHQTHRAVSRVRRHRRDRLAEYAREAEASYAATIGDDLPRDELRKRLRTAAGRDSDAQA